MSTPLGHSALTTKSNIDNLLSENINRSIRIGQKYLQSKDEKISIEL